jgi:ribosomal protein L32
MKADKTLFTCPRCGYKGRKFHHVCMECGRPFFRDFIDTWVHPRDPDPAGIYSGKFWEGIFLVFTILGLALYLLASLGILLAFLNAIQ